MDRQFAIMMSSNTGNTGAMDSAQIKISPPLADMLGATGTDWLIFEREIEEGASIATLLAGLAYSHPKFRSVFDPYEGKIINQVMVILNESLIQLSDLSEAAVKKGDTIVLIPDHYGG